MGSIAPHHLAQVGRFISEAADGAISLTTLAKRLGTTFPTARRRLEAYAAQHGLELVATTGREGKRGKASELWHLRPGAEQRLRAAVVGVLPRDASAALTEAELVERLRPSLPAGLGPALVTRWLTELLTDPHAGVVLTPERRLYLDPSTAKTGRMPAVKRAKPPLPGRRGPQADPSPRQRAPRAEPALPADLPAATLAALTPTERRALAHLLHRGLARTSELSSALALGASRLDGMLRAIRAKLRAHGGPTFTDEPLPSGETLYRVTRGAR